MLESVLQNKPVGGLLIWRSTIPLTSKRYDNNNDNFLKSYILDGQQRLTALYIIMYGKLPYYYSKDEVELKDFKIIISLKNFPTYELYFKEKITNPENQIEISHLLSDNVKELEEVISIDQIMEEIVSNEDDDTEFKSSLRWDYELDKKNANLEKNIIKTIAGFTNHIGGNLYIGVNDDNELLGIKKDLDIFDGSIDKFYRHLVQIIVENFDTTFFNNNIKISFPSINKRDLLEKLDDEKKIIEEEKLLLEEESEQTKTLCLIEVKQSNELKFIKETSNSGNKIIKCYVREGPLTNLLPQDEIISYNKNRFT